MLLSTPLGYTDSSFQALAIRGHRTTNLDLRGQECGHQRGTLTVFVCVRDTMKASPIRTPFVLPFSIAPKLPACIPHTPLGSRVPRHRVAWLADTDVCVPSLPVASSHPYTRQHSSAGVYPPSLARHGLQTQYTLRAVPPRLSYAAVPSLNVAPSARAAPDQGHFPESNARPTMVCILPLGPDTLDPSSPVDACSQPLCLVVILRDHPSSESFGGGPGLPVNSRRRPHSRELVRSQFLSTLGGEASGTQLMPTGTGMDELDGRSSNASLATNPHLAASLCDTEAIGIQLVVFTAVAPAARSRFRPRSAPSVAGSRGRVWWSGWESWTRANCKSSCALPTGVRLFRLREILPCSRIHTSASLPSIPPSSSRASERSETLRFRHRLVMSESIAFAFSPTTVCRNAQPRHPPRKRRLVLKHEARGEDAAVGDIA
ncbi:hypothetical protein C8F01DRAFT_1261839 [Mycena amicta]|nr:hypothetical protein C8F01DRAFT_1261839 [Mycena amicta]